MTATFISAISGLYSGFDIFSMGIIIAMVFMTIAFSRSLTKDDTYWAISTGAISFLLILIFPNLKISGLLLLIGVFSTTLAFFNLLTDKNQNQSINAGIIAIIFIILNITVSATVGFYDNIDGFRTNPETAVNDMLDKISITNTKYNNLFGNTAPNGLQYCEPFQLQADNTSCVQKAASGTFLSNAFVPLATIFNIADFGGKAIGLISASVTGLNYYDTLTGQGRFQDIPQIIRILFSLYIMLLQIVVLWKGIQYFTNKWGG